MTKAESLGVDQEGSTARTTAPASSLIAESWDQMRATAIAWLIEAGRQGRPITEKEIGELVDGGVLPDVFRPKAK